MLDGNYYNSYNNQYKIVGGDVYDGFFRCKKAEYGFDPPSFVAGKTAYKTKLRLLSPGTALPIIVKAVVSLIVAVNPSSILLVGNLLDEEKAEQPAAFEMMLRVCFIGFL